MGLCFFDGDPVFDENIRTIQAVDHHWGAILYSINFQELMTSRPDDHALLFLYEEMERVATLYLILIKLGLLKKDDFTTGRMVEQVVAPLFRSVLEVFFKVKYIFAWAHSKHDIEAIEDRFKEICRISIDAYNKAFKKAVELNFGHMMTQLDIEKNEYKIGCINTFDLLSATVNKESESLGRNTEESNHISSHNYLRYTHLCLYTHGSLSQAFRNRFNIEKSFGYEYINELKKISSAYVSLLRKYGLQDHEELLLDNQVRKYKVPC